MDQKTLNILIVDDDDGDRKHIQRILKKTGLLYDYIAVASLKQALVYCEKQIIDCMLIDYQLPGEDSLTSIATLSHQFPYMAIIMLTGTGNETIAVEAMKHGAVDYLTKNSIDSTLLEKTILSAIEKQQLKQQLHEQEVKVNHLAYYDYLTDIPNRVFFEYAVSKALAHAKRYKKIMAILFIDLDRFKTINDVLGHECGDLLLKEVTKRFQQTLREEDTLARLGGDEFGLLITQIDQQEQVELIAKKILQSLKDPFLLAAEKITVTPSIGIAVYPIAGQSVSTLMRSADKAMYQVKKAEKK